MDDIKDITIIVKWCGNSYPVDLTNQDTVAILKHEICRKTQVRPERQKLLNLKYKGLYSFEGPSQGQDCLNKMNVNF